jgi:hypothetical protein
VHLGIKASPALAGIAIAFACGDPLPTDPDNPQPPPPTGQALPKPNPDHGPPQHPGVQPTRAQQTPAPIEGDPNPEHKRTVWLQVACAPLAEYAEITWSVGAQTEHIRERRCERGYEKTVDTWKGARVNITANWTEASFGNLNSNRTGSIIIRVKVNGNFICDVGTKLGTLQRGIACPPFTV